MQASDAPENFQQQVLSELKQIGQRLDRLEVDVRKIETEVEKIDYKFDTYQKASESGRATCHNDAHRRCCVHSLACTPGIRSSDQGVCGWRCR